MNNYYSFIFKSKNFNPIISIYLIFKLFLFRKRNFLDKRYNEKFKIEYKEYLNEPKKNFSEDFFSYNIKYLVRIFYKYKLLNKKLNILEIGSYEGRSANFFLSILKNSNIHCVDIFNSDDELKSKNFNSIYKNFQKNTEQFKKRIKLFNGTSDKFFEKYNENKFDFVYIDGNHSDEQVYKDAENSFQLLNKYGIIVFDDFMWNYYPKINKNPIGAVKKFISKNFFKIKIISISYQIAIMKII